MKKNLRTSTSSQASEDSLLQENGLDLERLHSVKKKSSARKSYKRDSGRLLPTPNAGDSKKVVDNRTVAEHFNREKKLKEKNPKLGELQIPLALAIKMAFQSSQKSETLMEQNTEMQFSLLEDSHASRFPLPDSEEARKMTATSGQKCSELLVRQSLVGYLQRMCLASSKWHSTRCLLIWKAKVTSQGRLLFQLVASTPRIRGIEFGLLPTARAGEFKGGQYQYDRGNHDKPRVTLSGAIKMLPTPTKRDYKSEKCSKKIFNKNARPLSETFGKKTGMKLQPNFVEWMMGFPIGWTDLKP